jgi:quercetin dioxygenase-like cupin family protein
MAASGKLSVKAKLLIVIAVVAAMGVGLGVGLAMAKSKTVAKSTAARPMVTFMPIALGPIAPFDDTVHIKGGGDLRIAMTGPPMILGFRRLVFPPGAVLPWHQHPGAALVAVAEGQIREYSETFVNCGPQIGRPGKVRWEPGDSTHTLINTSKADAVIYVLSFDAPAYVKKPLIPKPKPAGCPNVP